MTQDEEVEEPRRHKRVNPNGKQTFLHGPTPTVRQMMRWVCHVCEPGGRRIGTGILVGPQDVLTPYHVIGKERIDDVSKFNFLFDDIVDQESARHLKLTSVQPVVSGIGVEGPVIFSSLPSPFDVGTSMEPPDRDSLDFLIVRLSEPIGVEPLDDGIERGWVSLDQCRPFPETGDVVILSHPEGGQPLERSEGKAVKADIPGRCHYSANAVPGCSGGLVYLDGDAPRPIAMHIGGQRTVGGVAMNFGVPLNDVLNAATADGKFRTPTTPTASAQKLNIAVLCGRPDGAARDYCRLLRDLFSTKESQDAFKRHSFDPTLAYKAISDFKASDLFNLADENISLNYLHEAAQADIALVVISNKDAKNGMIRDKLMAAYGYLIARLGNHRVHLFYPNKLKLNHIHLANNEFIHRYEARLTDVASRMETIALATGEPAEDLYQGLFELIRVALPELPDDRVFQTIDFGATETLHIIGLRFLNLGSRLSVLFDTLARNPDNPRLTIAFPGAEVSLANPYLMRSLQADEITTDGGGGPLQFLLQTRELLNDGRYDRAFLERISYFSMTDIPSFILTAANLDQADGRMLIAPAFRADLHRGKPRLLIQNKLSTWGMYHSYKSVVESYLDPNKAGNESWTLDNFEATNAHIEKLRSLPDHPS